MSSASEAIASRDGTTRITPFSTTETRAISRLGSTASWVSTSVAMRWASSSRVGDAQRVRRFVVLCLGEGICGDPRRVRGFVAQDQNLAGARDAVDADLAIDQALGARDVAVTRTDDFVDFGDGRGAIRRGRRWLARHPRRGSR